MITQALPYVSFLGFLFGTSLIASSFSVGQFEPATYLGLRLTLAGFCHAVIYVLISGRRWPTDRRLLRHASVLGVFGTAIPMTAFVTALLYLSSGITALLITAIPALTVLLAHHFLPDEALTRRKGLGVALALGGAVLLVVSGESGLPEASQTNPIGYALLLFAMVSFSGSSIYVRLFMRDLNGFDVASVRMFVAALVVMPLSLLVVGIDLDGVDRQGYLALLYAALIGTFAAFILSFHNVKRFGASVAAMSAYVTPVVASIGGVLLLGETLAPVVLVGMVLIVFGISLINPGSAAQIKRAQSALVENAD